MDLVARMTALSALRPMVSIEERFWAKVEPEPNSGCWLWLGATTDGYAILGRGRRSEGLVRAHRFSYELLRGPIIHPLEPDHLCRVRACVNPWHLELVTRSENNRRGLLGKAMRGHPGARW